MDCKNKLIPELWVVDQSCSDRSNLNHDWTLDWTPRQHSQLITIRYRLCVGCFIHPRERSPSPLRKTSPGHMSTTNINTNEQPTQQQPAWWLKCCSTKHWLGFRHLPDACTNQQHEEWVLQQRRSQQSHDDRSKFHRFFIRERNLLIVMVLLVLLLNFRFGRLILYPFRLLSTWVHEVCHGLAAVLSGGKIGRLQIFRDGSGLAFTVSRSNFGAAFTSSAGYPGTSVFGFILLLFRRTTLGPTFGTIGLGCAIFLTVVLWVRNTFGVIILALEGLILILLGWKLPAVAVDSLYNLLAATLCLNAVENIRNLFGSGTFTVAGEEVQSSDAHTVADRWGGDFRLWAALWLLFSLLLTGLGLWLSLDGRPLPDWLKRRSQGEGVSTRTASASTSRGPDLTV